MRVLSNLLEAVGLLAVAAGAALFDWRLGVVVGGLVCLLAGLGLDPPRRDG